MTLLKIDNLHATVADKPILKGLSLTINAGEVHAIMGPNGAGKSTLSYVLGGRPGYEVTEGSVMFMGQDLLALEPHERAAILYRIAALIRERSEALAQLQRRDNGKPISETRAPRWASMVAATSPMPADAPVTTICLPLKFTLSLSEFFSLLWPNFRSW